MLLLKKRYWVVLALCLTLFLIVRGFPAGWVIYGAQQAVPGLQASGVGGSLWEGRATYIQWVGRGHTIPLGEVHWRLRGLSVLTLNPCVDISSKARQQTFKGELCYSLMSEAITLAEVDVSVPMAVLAPFFNIDADGQVDAYINQAAWKDQQLGATDINFLWQQASLSNGNQWIPLGDIQALLNDDGNGGLMSQWNNVDDVQKPSPVNLDINATATQLSSAKPLLSVKGTVTPGPRAAALEQMLQFVGEPVGNGAYRIDIAE